MKPACRQLSTGIQEKRNFYNVNELDHKILCCGLIAGNAPLSHGCVADHNFPNVPYVRMDAIGGVPVSQRAPEFIGCPVEKI